MVITEVIIPYDVEQKLIWKHQVQAYEVEEVFDNKPLIRFREKGRVQGEDLYTARGQTEAGRYLMALFIHKKSSEALVISARDMTKRELQRYGKNK